MVTFKTMGYEELKKIKRHVASRKIDAKHVKALEKQMLKNLNSFPPIIVNKRTMMCLDGNHRLEAFRNLYEQGKIEYDAFPVMFVSIDKDKQSDAIRNMAQCQEIEVSLNKQIVKHLKNNKYEV